MRWVAVGASNAPKPLNASRTVLSDDVLLLQSTVDPSTSIEWAMGLKEQLPRSRMVIRDGVGHTSYILGGETSDIVDRYLLHGALPVDNTVTFS